MTDFKINYKEQYDQLILYRQQNKLEKSKEELGKIESHHVLPRSCGGSNDPNNLVNLYAKEHFMAHYYLWKMHENDEFKCQTLNAFWMMCVIGSSKQDRTYQEFIKMSEEYQQARIEFAKQCSKLMAEKVKGFNNGNYGKHWYYDPVTNESHPYIDGQQPTNWILGRKYKDRDSFAKAVSKATKDTCWIYSIDLTTQKHVDKRIALDLVATGKWKYGRLNQLSDTNKKEYSFKRRIEEENKKKRKIEKIKNKRKIEVEQIELSKQFRPQITELYKGVVDRKQVRRYLEFKGKHSCNNCGKENIKLIVHSIDGNCKNLSIDNYEFLCYDCYLKSGTSGFSGHSRKKISNRNNNTALGE